MIGFLFAFTLVITDHNYTDETEFTLQSQCLLSHLYSYPVYKRHWDETNIRLFHHPEGYGCYTQQTSYAKVLNCDGAAVFRVLRDEGIAYDKVIILVRDVKGASNTGKGGSVLVVTAGKYAGPIAAHELGHAVGDLYEEYVTTTNEGNIDQRVHDNCLAGTPPTPEWVSFGSKVSYYLGCHHPNWYRSSKCSVMKSISCPTYNAVSEAAIEAGLQQLIVTEE